MACVSPAILVNELHVANKANDVVAKGYVIGSDL